MLLRFLKQHISERKEIAEKLKSEKISALIIEIDPLRKNEAEEVVQTFKNEMDLNLIKVDAQKIFLRHYFSSIRENAFHYFLL